MRYDDIKRISLKRQALIGEIMKKAARRDFYRMGCMETTGLEPCLYLFIYHIVSYYF